MRLELVLLKLASNPPLLHLYRLIGEGRPYVVEKGRVIVFWDAETQREWM